jgi:chromosome segregation protein
VYLKRLELLGFKSFPDKTVIKLTRGIISIVGPNGCGKTNILDSIRWVLGEQKVSLLRGTKMEEIIFNGTKDIKPLGMAEVTLVIQNNKGILPTEYGEVQITRRLFRSGESEYLLNKVPCRLKDIGDLLMDTGIGAHVYSVIQQDMIDAILSDRADDRRFLFEEAAGISKYKNRKKAALRKLESTEQDLLRLKDIVAEITTQANSLNRQMKKAERYQKAAEELKKWDIYSSKNTINSLQNERHRLHQDRDTLLDSKIKFDTEIDAFSASQEKQRNDLNDIGRELNVLTNQIFDKSEAGHKLEREISILREKKENARSLKERNALDMEALAKRRDILNEQIAQSENELLKAGIDLQQIEGEITRFESELTEADSRVLISRHSREELNKELMAMEGRLSAGKSDDTNLREQETEINNGLSSFDNLVGAINEKQKATQDNLSDKSVIFSEIQERLANLQNHRAELENEIAALNIKSEEVSAELSDLTASLEAAQARKHLLADMIAHYEGYNSGVIATFENKDQWPGLIGTLADNMTPKNGFEDAIESALGEMAGYVICRDRQTAENVIDYLRSEKRGKAGFIILDEAGRFGQFTHPEINNDGFIGWADQHVTVSDELRAMAQILLAGTAIIKPEALSEISKLLPPSFSAVTTDGKLINNLAIMTGGSNEGLSLFGRKEKITEQDNIINELTNRANQLREMRTEITTIQGTRQGDLRNIIASIESTGDEIENLEKELTSLRYEFQTATNELQRLEKERKTLSNKLELLKGRQYDLTLNYDNLAREKEQLVAKLNESATVIGEFETNSEKAQSRLSAVQISQIELKSKRQQIESQIRHTRELIFEIKANSDSKASEIITADEDINLSVEKMAVLEKELKDAFDARMKLQEQQISLRQEFDQIQEVLNNREKEIKSIRQMREEATQKLHIAEIRMTEIEAETRNIADKIRDEYDLNLADITAESPDPDLAEDKRAERIAELREIMKIIGAVNLLALEEYQTIKERQEFLSTQMNDLLNAKSTLLSTITKINSTAKRLFLETFDKVRESFQKVFLELFTGGEADIKLLEPEDPLESPIEIIARPRGKKLLSIAQMSGGERALTAISLLFAIYLVKPSPFCILDEIDAPLDDANIHRFLKMIKAFSDQTQFIIITHNKITMEAADVLYGVTMEQPGVSRVVSVRFDDESDDVLINTSIDKIDAGADTPLPESIRKRISSEVSVNSPETDN